MRIAEHVGPPPEVTIEPPPKTIGDAVASMHENSRHMATILDRLEGLLSQELDQTPPEMHTVVINPGNGGSYISFDRCRFEAKSIGILNPGAAPVFIGIGGVSATPTSRAPSCAGSSALVLPVLVPGRLELGCDPVVLAAGTAVVYVFHYLTVQPLFTSNV